ncbi:kinesin light chain 1, partial [Rasamsonia emersonii CBS 393.64]
MDPLSVVGLVGNIVQFVDFTGKLISKSVFLYHSGKGVLPENIDIETATKHLVLLNTKLKDAATSTGSRELQRLCTSCGDVADELLAAVDKVKVKGEPGKWKSVQKALRSVWSKDDIEGLEKRLARFREELNLHIALNFADSKCDAGIKLLSLEQSTRIASKNSTLQQRKLLDAIIRQRDVFQPAHEAQLTLMKDLHGETVTRIEDEHEITRREIIHEIRKRLPGPGHDMSGQEQGTSQQQDPCFSVPFIRNRQFVNRGQLDEVERRLFIEGNCPKVAIYGLGGVGKTQIALELAYRTREQRPDYSVFWVPATTVENFQQAYLDIGRKLHLLQPKEQKEDIKKIVRDYLSRESAGHWLLIYDNADDIDMWVENTNGTNEPTLINYIPRSNKGSIIFTTRNRKAAVKLAHQNVVGIREMDEDAAIQMLSRLLIDQQILNDRHIILDLLEQLTFLPLAIAQAAAYMNENGITVSEYLSLLRDKEQNIIEVLSENFEDEGRYRHVKNPVATTWLISFDQIRCRDPLAAEYLSFMACLNPKAIPQSLLPPAPSKKRMTDAIGTLSGYSFITRRPADESLDLHRLVHLATRNWLRMENCDTEWVAKAIARLDCVFPSHDHKNRDLWRAYLPHAQYLVGSDLGNGVRERLSLLMKLGQCLLSDGRYNDAEKPFLEVMEARKKVLGEEHPATLASMANLASTYRNQGRWKEAE